MHLRIRSLDRVEFYGISEFTGCNRRNGTTAHANAVVVAAQYYNFVAGLKVFLDVVYNHTGEYGLLSFRGLDNPTYYSLTADRRGSMNNTGVSGNFNTHNPAAQALMTRHVAPSEQGRLQGAISGLQGVAFMIGPGLFTGAFAAAIGSQSAWHLPGAPFFLAALILAASFVLAWRVAGR